MPFRFDANKSPRDNVELFLVHLDTVDPDLAPLLRAHISELVPFPADAQARSAARSRANAAIRTALDANES
jgi:hypothetical protein